MCVDESRKNDGVAEVDYRIAAQFFFSIDATDDGFGKCNGAVLDGRDIGTVICPGAEVKLFVTASDEVRAARRWAELAAKGEDVEKAQVLTDIRARDARDRDRDVLLCVRFE